MASEAFYIAQSETFVPTGLGVSGWNARAQMGVALAGLATHVLERVASPAPMVPARLTIDILGAVPLEPLTAEVKIIREGKRMQVLQAELSQGGRTWVRATMLRVRTAESPMLEMPLTRHFPVADASTSASVISQFASTIRVQGGYPHQGPGAWWVKPRLAVVEGIALSPLEALGMVSDYGSGVAPLVSPEDWTFANVDISIHLTRAPRGDWILIDATSESAGNGIGLIHSRLGDREGMIGMAHQTVFLDRR